MMDAPILNSFAMRYDHKPWLVNAERSMHFHTRAGLTREWREAFAWMAKVDKAPKMEAAVIVVRHFCKTNRLPDVGACFPAYKAALDGLVDAGVLVDDGPLYVRAVTFEAPVNTGRDGLELEVFEVSA